jgi:hypothetical protein
MVMGRVDEKEASDEIIAVGGRDLRAKIIQGSKEKKIIARGLEQYPVFEYIRELT